jgi:hypothetical protein
MPWQTAPHSASDLVSAQQSYLSVSLTHTRKKSKWSKPQMLVGFYCLSLSGSRAGSNLLTVTFRWHSLFRIPTQPPCVHERHLVCGPRDWHGGCYGTIVWSAISLALRLCFATDCTRCPVQKYLGSQLEPWSHCDAPANANRAMIPCITHPHNINTRTYP